MSRLALASLLLVASSQGGTLGSEGYPGDVRFQARIRFLDDRPWTASHNVAGHSYELRWDESPDVDPPMEIVDVTD